MVGCGGKERTRKTRLRKWSQAKGESCQGPTQSTFTPEENMPFVIGFFRKSTTRGSILQGSGYRVKTQIVARVRAQRVVTIRLIHGHGQNSGRDHNIALFEDQGHQNEYSVLG